MKRSLSITWILIICLVCSVSFIACEEEEDDDDDVNDAAPSGNYYTVYATDYVGTDTGLAIAAGNVINLSAPGEWCWGPGTLCCSADGEPYDAAHDGQHVIDTEGLGLLIGKIGTSGVPFAVGSSKTITASDSGNLILLMNDRIDSDYFYYGDNSGYLNVTVQVN